MASIGSTRDGKVIGFVGLDQRAKNYQLFSLWGFSCWIKVDEIGHARQCSTVRFMVTAVFGFHL